MEKQQIISFIKEQILSGKISNSDLIGITNNGGGEINSTEESKVPNNNSRNLTNIFYVIGVAIAIIGVIILIAQNWDEIGFAGRILVTLGIGLVTYITALLIKGSEHRVLSQSMFTISAILSPMGIFVLLNEYNINIDININIILSIGLAIVYGFALYISKRNILSIFTIAFSTWAYYAFIAKIFDIGYLYGTDIIKWATMLIGLAYILIAYGYYSNNDIPDKADKKEKVAIKNILYSLGTIAILGAGISVGGFFDIIFIAIIFAAFYASIFLKNSSMIIIAGIFLISHILKLTSKYFLDSIGWPIALIISGFIVMGVGYLTYYINKRFIKETSL